MRAGRQASRVERVVCSVGVVLCALCQSRAHNAHYAHNHQRSNPMAAPPMDVPRPGLQTQHGHGEDDYSEGPTQTGHGENDQGYHAEGTEQASPPSPDGPPPLFDAAGGEQMDPPPLGGPPPLPIA